MDKYTLVINSCGITDCSPSWHWETAENGFDDYDLWAVFRGNGELNVNGEEFSVSAGDCFLLPPHHAIIGRHKADDPLLVMNVHFSFINDGIAVCDLPLSKRYVADRRFFQRLLERVIYAHYQENSQKAELWLSSALEEFFSSPDEVQKESISSLHIGYIDDMCRKINENVAQYSSLEYFADEFGYSPAYLGRLFHRITKVSFSQYLMNARINKAKLLLRSTDLSVSQISLELGYYDSGHFIRQFKKITAYTPKDYRNKHSM